MQIVMFYITHPDKETAEKIVKACIDRKLAACGNIFPISSCYEWEMQMQSDDEWVSILKTTATNIQNLNAFVESEHPYDVPCIIHYEVKVNDAYGEWVTSQVN